MTGDESNKDSGVAVCPDCGLAHGGACPSPPSAGTLCEPASGARKPPSKEERQAQKLVGTIIAEHYEIQSLVGLGGMSVVYRARHTLLGRTVAIKLLHEHLVAREQNLARFQQEARAASHLTHPHIIGVHEFGVTPAGQPFLVMDYVKGASLGDLIEREGRLAPERALPIFRQICSALAHAHGKGIIHRDIKPSNVMLVEEGDQSDLVKLVDFGIAKLLPGHELEGERLTQTGEVFGSPVYMSPEQCTGKALDPRSDIYSLGCVMYEVLTGSPPFAGANPLETMYLRLSDPPEPFNPQFHIPRQIEAVVLIALAREPEKRYQTMLELDGELESVEDGRGTISGLLSLKRSARLKKARKVKRLVPREFAYGLAALTVAVSALLAWKLFAGGSPPVAGGAATAPPATDAGAGDAGGNLSDLADLTLSLVPRTVEKDRWPQYRQLANRLQHLAMLCIRAQDYDRAEQLLKKSLEIEKTVLGDGSPQVAQTMSYLAALYATRSGQYQNAMALYEQAVQIRTRALGAEHPEVAASLSDLAALYQEQGKYQKAEELYRKALRIYEKNYGAGHPDVAGTLTGLADLYRIQGRYAEAEPLYERALAINSRSLGPEHITVAMSLNNLAGLYFNEGKYARAESMYSRALALYEKVQGPEHPSVATILNNLGVVDYREGKYGQAEPILKRALAIRERFLTPDHPEVAQSLNSLAEVYRARGKFAQAEPLYNRALSIDQRMLGAGHPEVAVVLNSMGQLYMAEGRYELAHSCFERALSIREAAFGTDHPDVASSLNQIAILYGKEGKYGQAEEMFRKALAIREKTLGPGHPEVAATLNDYADLLFKLNRLSDALNLKWRAAGIWFRTLGLTA